MTDRDRGAEDINAIYTRKVMCSFCRIMIRSLARNIVLYTSVSIHWGYPSNIDLSMIIMANVFGHLLLG